MQAKGNVIMQSYILIWSGFNGGQNHFHLNTESSSQGQSRLSDKDEDASGDLYVLLRMSNLQRWKIT